MKVNEPGLLNDCSSVCLLHLAKVKRSLGPACASVCLYYYVRQHLGEKNISGDQMPSTLCTFSVLGGEQGIDIACNEQYHHSFFTIHQSLCLLHPTLISLLVFFVQFLNHPRNLIESIKTDESLKIENHMNLSKKTNASLIRYNI